MLIKSTHLFGTSLPKSTQNFFCVGSYQKMSKVENDWNQMTWSFMELEIRSLENLILDLLIWTDGTLLHQFFSQGFDQEHLNDKLALNIFVLKSNYSKISHFNNDNEVKT